MKIALVGYGKMGEAIDRLAHEQGHQVVRIIKGSEDAGWAKIHPDEVDVAIEFTQPEAAFDNLKRAIARKVKTISGTTGWLHRLPEIRKQVEQTGGTFLHASNFSVGVNLFFQLNEWLTARSGNSFTISMEETHHTQKLDAPSGTAIRIAEGILSNTVAYDDWTKEKPPPEKKIPIVSHREPNVPGTHIVKYQSRFETIALTHVAHDRDLFAQGALDVAMWAASQSGWLTMDDYLNKK